MLNWLDQRTGFISMTKDFLTEDVPGGASYWYAFGSATVFAMIMQIVTGIFLTFYYSPSASTAWESTSASSRIPAGQLVLSLHYWGATAMIAFMMMHMLQVLLWGAYKKPRELQWIVGVLFYRDARAGTHRLPVAVGPQAHFASKVAIKSPVRADRRQVRADYFAKAAGIGTLTINRFFGIHVWLTPAVLVLLVGMHLAIFRWNGSAGPPTDERPKLKPGRFWPDQMFMDTVVSFAMFVIVFALASFSPAARREGRPEQHAVRAVSGVVFLALFGFARAVTAKVLICGPLTIGTELLATIVVPTIFWRHHAGGAVARSRLDAAFQLAGRHPVGERRSRCSRSSDSPFSDRSALWQSRPVRHRRPSRRCS